ncbi:hypothetical protein [Alteribacillus sp. YIM 98480]|uniref:hypothetical protein n=1 Tax=Alteribacillus sp. YIM 98480 TaxID=2606599 RepID=UPI00131DD1F1|nr:hypothetical protein [Alteribacillus sp. YIM 98480]
MIKKFENNTPVIVLKQGNHYQQKGEVIRTFDDAEVLVKMVNQKGRLERFKESDLKHDVDTILRQIHARQGKLLGEEKADQ